MTRSAEILSPTMAVTNDQIHYEPRRPQDSILFHAVNDNLKDFLSSLEEDPDARGFPDFVRREFEKFLACGFYEKGVTRIGCKDPGCGEDYWLPTSCKCRGFCPSCGGRRMNVFAINLDERVIPFVPVRQYVVSVPIPLRNWMVVNHELTLQINQIIIRAIRAVLRRKARNEGVPDGIIGAVTFIQRFGSALNLNPHFHILCLDGVYEETTAGFRFFETQPLDDEDASHLVERICRNVTMLLVKEGYLEELSLEPDPDKEDSLNDDSTALSSCKLASVFNRVAFGVRRGLSVRRVGAGQFGYGQGESRITGRLCAQHAGFSLHAATVIDDLDRERLKNLVAYVTRPAVSLKRLSWTETGDIKVTLKTPWSDGTSAIVLSPTELIEKLAALVPYPRKNLVIYSGCLAPNHSLRRFIVPLVILDPQEDNGEDSVVPVAQDQDSIDPVENEQDRYIPWAELLKKTFGIDLFTCRKCGGPTIVKAFITDPQEVKKIMNHFGIEPRPPPSRPNFEIVYDLAA